MISKKIVVSTLQMTSNNVLQDNLACLEALIQAACLQNIENKTMPHLIVAPEYFCDIGGDKRAVAVQYEEFLKQTLSDFAKKYSIYLVAGTIPTIPTSLDNSFPKVCNTCFTFNPQGEIIGTYHKHHLFRFVNPKNPQENYDESLVLQAGENDDDNIQIIETSFGKIGVGICFDLRFPQFFQKLRQQGAALFVLPSAFTHTTGLAHWEILLRARSIENQTFMVASNQGGIHFNKRHTFGHSMIINAWGTVLKSMKQEVGHVSSVIDLNEVHELRDSLPLNISRAC